MKKEHKRRKKGKMVAFAVLIVVILAAVAIVVSRNAKKEEPELISLTAPEKMSGIWLWKKDRKFWIEYAGVVTVGIDASLVNMEVKDDTVTITLPPAKILGCKVDESTLTEDSFIVAKDSAKVEAEHQTAAFQEAQDNMRKEAEKDTVLLASAQQRAQKLLDDYVNNIGACTGKTYTIKWIYLDGAKELQEAESE